MSKQSLTATGLGIGSGETPARNNQRWHWIRVSFSAIWLVYLAQPLSNLPSGHHGTVWLTTAAAITVGFCAAFIAAVANSVRPSRLAPWALAVLFALAFAFSLVFSGPSSQGNVAWIYVASAGGWIAPNRRAALRLLAAILACYALVSWLGHQDMSSTLITLIPIICVCLAMSGMRTQMVLLAELRKARAEVTKLAANEERLRLARDVHDLTGQSLSTITLKSELAARLLDKIPASADVDRAREEIGQVAAVSRQALHDIRDAISGYRRPTLAVEAITARSALDSAGIMTHEEDDLITTSGTFDPDAEGALAWCLREAVTNVIRHSGASNCYISLSRQAGTVSLTVRDDGTGMRSADCPGTGTGLHGMAERLRAVGGSLELHPAGQAGGFCLAARVPDATASGRPRDLVPDQVRLPEPAAGKRGSPARADANVSG